MSAQLPPDQQWWTSQRFGLLVHTSAAAVPAWAPIGEYADWYRAHLDGAAADTLLHPSPMVETLAHHRDRWGHVDDYDDFVDLLTYDDFEADEWADLARRAGASCAVMVAKHHDGLCWWDAPGTANTVVNRGPMRNVLGEFAAACDRAGLTFGTYYSLLDWSDPRYPRCGYVDEVAHPQVLDLVRRYGSRMLWGDGHWGGGGEHWRSDELIANARRIDHSLVINHRWWAQGPAVRTFEYQMPDAAYPDPWEHRRGIGAGFGYNRAEQADHLLDGLGIVGVLTEVVAKGGNLLLAVGPDARGRIPAAHATPLRDAGRWIVRHSGLLAAARPWKVWGDDHSRYLDVDGTLHAVDLRGGGHFAALGRANGVIRRVTRADRPDEAVVFEQSAEALRLLGVRTAARRRVTEPDDVIVYRVELEPVAAAPIELFAAPAPSTFDLAEQLADAQPGQIVQLGDGTYVGPARVPDGVTVRGLGPHRTRLASDRRGGVVLGLNARIEHCTISGDGERIVWLPKVVLTMSSPLANLLGCRVDGHVEVSASDCRLTSCSLTGVVARGADRLVVARSTFRGMSWDCAIDIEGGSNHVVESCEFSAVLEAIRLTATTSTMVRGNRIAARWWGVRTIDAVATNVTGNHIDHTMRAIDVDGGVLTSVVGNAVADGDSGCIVQRGAGDIEVVGNRWERTRIGLLAWDAGDVRHHGNSAVGLLESDAEATAGP